MWRRPCPRSASGRRGSRSRSFLSGWASDFRGLRGHRGRHRDHHHHGHDRGHGRGHDRDRRRDHRGVRALWW